MRNLTGFFFLFRIRASKLYAELSRHPFKSNSFLEIDYFRQVRAINEPDEMQKKKSSRKLQLVGIIFQPFYPGL